MRTIRKLWTVALLFIPGCLAGCSGSATRWEATEGHQDTNVSTMFTIRLANEIAIGFPGTHRNEANIEASGEVVPPAPAPSP